MGRLRYRLFRLPRPSGAYGIGSLTCTWTDQDRPEIFGDGPRRIVAQVWYPSPLRTGCGQPYTDNGRELSANLARALSGSGLVKVPSFALRYLALVATHSTPGAPVADGSFPVVVFASGVSGFRQSNLVQVEGLVSHGFVVIGLDQPYVSAAVTLPDGRTIPGRPRAELQPLIDQSLEPAPAPPVLNGLPLPDGLVGYLGRDVSLAVREAGRLNRDDPRLAGHLDLTRAGAFGVSLGAMAVAQAGHDDPRIRACLMIDAAMPAVVAAGGLDQPSLWITRPEADMRRERSRAGGWTEHDIDQLFSSVRSAAARSRGFTAIEQLPGMFHTDFTDAVHYVPIGRLVGISGPGARPGNARLTSLTTDFFRRHLAN